VASLKPEPIETPYRTVDITPAELGAQIRWADIIHVHGARSKLAAVSAAWAWRIKKPVFYTPHAFYDPKSFGNAIFKALWDQTAEKFLLEKSYRTILLTDAWYDFLARRRISSARTTIIPNCVLSEDLVPVPRREVVGKLAGLPAILTIGRLDPVKRVDDIIRAIALDSLADAHLHVVGRGAARESLEWLALSLGVSERVTFHGFVKDLSVADMVAGSDVFVLASEQEGLPTVLLEMLIGRLPVVCSSIPGNLVIMNVAGLKTVFPVGDIAALAALLSSVKWDRVSLDVVTALRETFLWDSRAADILKLYESALGEVRRL
jgi:glycosyltransferase involved in cell wall biosynthesis